MRGPVVDDTTPAERGLLMYAAIGAIIALGVLATTFVTDAWTGFSLVTDYTNTHTDLHYMAKLHFVATVCLYYLLEFDEIVKDL